MCVITVGILSDSHGYLDPKVKNIVNQCDYIVHAGDIFCANVLEQLKPKKKLIAVAGNNDHPLFWKSKEVDIVKSLPKINQLKLETGTIIVEHGDRLGHRPNHRQLRNDHAHARLIVYGHTHHLSLDQTEQPWVVNPGASGKIRTHGGASCLVLQVNKNEWKLETFVFRQ